jgi:hypothetical protein
MLLLALILAGCGTTQVISNDPQARIIVDGVPKGQGIATVTKVGFPGSSQFIAETNDGRKTRQTISRSFAWTTALFGLFTYGICLIACWEYPETVFLYLPPPPSAQGEVTSDGTADPWLLPPTNWKD